MSNRPKFVCSACGAPGEGSCRCGANYIPASSRAAQAIAANPGKSDRAIAQEIGVSQPTVSKARKSGDKRLSPETRTGRDGKRYPAKPAVEPAPAQSDLDRLKQMITEFTGYLQRRLDSFARCEEPVRASVRESLAALRETVATHMARFGGEPAPKEHIPGTALPTNAERATLRVRVGLVPPGMPSDETIKAIADRAEKMAASKYPKPN